MLYLDIETRSSTNLKTHGVYRYVEDPDFKILMIGFSLDDEDVGVQTEDLTMVPGLFDEFESIVAHNAQFERICLSAEFGSDAFPPERFIDTAALAAAAGYPRKLEKLAPALRIPPKDSAGTRLINFFCKPKPGGGFRDPADHPEKWAEFVAYCTQDVETLIAAHAKLPELRPEEAELWVLDQKINDLGLPVDLDLAAAAVEASEANRIAQMDEARWLTGVENPNSTTQLLEWLNSKDGGLVADNLQAATVTKLMEKAAPTARRVLEIRQELALVASNKFAAAVRRTSADGRYRGAFTFHGAHTGRWTGSGVQFHNLPREQFKDAEGEFDHTAENSAILDLLLGHGCDAADLKKLIRAMFVGPFTAVDYSAIEARILAWMAGEEWMLQAFRQLRDLYIETGKRMGGLDRQRGKAAALGLGYQGSVASLRKQGVQGTDAELKKLVNMWRAAAPAIVQWWFELGETFWTGGDVGPLRIEKVGTDRVIHLPSGRTLTYHDVERKRGRLSFADPRGYRSETYGGSLTENVVQAAARDLLADAMLRLDELGYEIVGHVHDEVVIAGEHSVDEIAKIMCDLPRWAEGLPMAAAGEVIERYRKI